VQYWPISGTQACLYVLPTLPNCGEFPACKTGSGPSAIKEGQNDIKTEACGRDLSCMRIAFCRPTHMFNWNSSELRRAGRGRMHLRRKYICQLYLLRKIWWRRADCEGGPDYGGSDLACV